MNWFALIILTCLSGMPLCANAAECRFAKRTTVHKLPGNFVLHLTPIDIESTADGCRAKLIASNKKTVYSVTDWDLAVVLIGQDVNGDGTPDIVLEGYSGGAHCCWTYYIVSLGTKPGLLFKFENDRGADFVVNRQTGKMEIQALDGAFDYFDDSCHACSPFPDVYLRLEGRKLLDIGLEHVADYDKKIHTLRAEMPAKDLAVFMQAENASEKVGLESATPVLNIVLAYLYSGRQTQAYRTLQKMWPPFDQERIWKLILETRREGILRYTRSRKN